jgi:hypothetical protein
MSVGRQVRTMTIGLGLLSTLLGVSGCRSSRPPVLAAEPEPPPVPAPPPEPREEEPALVVKKVPDPIVVAAWAEPKALPAGGGSTQLLVRVQKPRGAPYPGVEVRFRAARGTLYSGGKVLVTDAQGLTRDRLTTHETATVTLNAGGTRYTFQVPVGQ